ncbi:SDR family oxidoreductase [Nocardioides convexus]|uniref:SDR family oxidoreductase n=1 Tax=Nocardioides convexus TaxID=2712224 RepID=UPI00241857AF|nr:SDR family oxidoreductase [Nocardioides convexus]
MNLAGKGARPALSDVNEAGLGETVELAVKAGSPDVHTARLDVADKAAFASYATEVAEHFGQVNVVINNAGVALAGDAVDLTYEDMEWIVGINFWGVVYGTKEFLPHLIASGDGHVVNLSSLFGLLAMPGQSAYNATKFAVRGFTEALREEMLIAGHKVGVTSVHPGGIKTAIARSARVSDKEDQAATAKSVRREARADDPGPRRRDHRQGHHQEPGPRPGRPRRARAAQLPEVHRLALRGHRRGALEAGAPDQGGLSPLVSPPWRRRSIGCGRAAACRCAAASSAGSPSATSCSSAPSPRRSPGSSPPT